MRSLVARKLRAGKDAAERFAEDDPQRKNIRPPVRMFSSSTSGDI
jgi:hypothetical protein